MRHSKKIAMGLALFVGVLGLAGVRAFAAPEPDPEPDTIMEYNADGSITVIDQNGAVQTAADGSIEDSTGKSVLIPINSVKGSPSTSGGLIVAPAVGHITHTLPPNP